MPDQQIIDAIDHPAVVALVSAAEALVSPPQVHYNLLEILNDPEVAVEEMGAVISTDPNLTARLLKIVNSPYYGLAKQVETVSRAVSVVGTRDLCDMVAAISATTVFSQLPSTLVNINTFSAHSLLTGMIARELARACKATQPERLFVDGLLHDIGSLLLYRKYPEKMAELLLMARGSEQLLQHLELSHLGFSHAQVGARVTLVWRLPEILCAAVAYHHAPLEYSAKHREPLIVHLAEQLANASPGGQFCGEEPQDEECDPEVLEALGVDMTTITEVTETAVTCFEQTKELFMA